MERLDNETVTIKVSNQEIKRAIVRYVKENNPDLKEVKPTISIYIDVHESLDVDFAELTFKTKQPC